MKKRTLLFPVFALLVSLACGFTDLAAPQPVIPTFDANSISTAIVQTSQALALSATATNTSQPSATASETPTPTWTPTSMPTETPTQTSTATPPVTVSATIAPSLTAAPTASPAVTVIYIQITNTLPPATQTSKATKPPASPVWTNTPAAATPPTTPVTPSATNTPEPSVCPTGNTSFEARVIELINQERANVGLSALNFQSQLTLAAQLHSADMACNHYFSHTGLDGSSFSDRARRQGYNIGYGGENIAAGYSSPESAVEGWMNSPGHKANILGENYVDVGIGFAYSKDSPYGTYWTAVFGSP